MSKYLSVRLNIYLSVSISVRLYDYLYRLPGNVCLVPGCLCWIFAGLRSVEGLEGLSRRQSSRRHGALERRTRTWIGRPRPRERRPGAGTRGTGTAGDSGAIRPNLAVESALCSQFLEHMYIFKFLNKLGRSLQLYMQVFQSLPS